MWDQSIFGLQDPFPLKSLWQASFQADDRAGGCGATDLKGTAFSSPNPRNLNTAKNFSVHTYLHVYPALYVE